MKSVAELMVEAEKADDAYGTAVQSAASARADYELAYYRALAQSVATSAAARKEKAEGAANDAHRMFIITEAAEKAAKTHVQVTLGLMVAAQSVQKHAGQQDGGTDWTDF